VDWTQSRAEAARFVVLDESPSTNTELAARAAAAQADDPEPDFSVLVTRSQTAGRGRLGRTWVAPPGQTLAISVLLRPVLPGGEPLELPHFGWLPLIAGVAMATAVESVLDPGRVGLKWPNDVQVDGLKVSGLLAELLPSTGAVVIGAGLNLSIRAADLPTPSSTSLELSGASLAGDELADAVLATYLGTLRSIYTEFVRLGADVEGSGVHELVSDRCSTIGQQVRVELPGADDLLGTATGIDKAGRLIVRRSADGHESVVAAGDVVHLRLA
jgi:BirA family biotin operon repressor/biotin-[acetyl-CoA-carboxylase] ligase